MMARSGSTGSWHVRRIRRYDAETCWRTCGRCGRRPPANWYSFFLSLQIDLKRDIFKGQRPNK